MTRLLLLGILAGVDNLQVAAAISVAPLARARRALLLVAFAACEIASPLIGVFFGHFLQIEDIGPYVVVACGIAIVVLNVAPPTSAARKLVNSRWTLIGLPLSLSFDNLLIGVSAASLGHPPAIAALVIGAISATLCVAGIVAGARISRLIPERAELVSGCALIIIAASMWIRS